MSSFLPKLIKKKQLQKKINKKIKQLLYSYYLLEDRGQGPHCLHNWPLGEGEGSAVLQVINVVFKKKTVCEPSVFMNVGFVNSYRCYRTSGWALLLVAVQVALPWCTAAQTFFSWPQCFLEKLLCLLEWIKVKQERVFFFFLPDLMQVWLNCCSSFKHVIHWLLNDKLKDQWRH